MAVAAFFFLDQTCYNVGKATTLLPEVFMRTCVIK